MDDYFVRFGMDENPFLKNSRQILVETRQFKESQERLKKLLKTKGFGVLTGVPGNGKTTSVRVWANGLNRSMYKVVYNELSTVSLSDFYRNLAMKFGLEPRYKKTDNFKSIHEEIVRYSEKRIMPIIIIDEAMHINNDILKDMKSLFNFDMDSRDLAIVLMTGTPDLNRNLNRPMHESLKQRLTMNYNMVGITKEEARMFIRTKLDGVGCTREVFTPNAIEAITNASEGTPRLINKIADRSMQIADSKNVNQIDAEIVGEAVSDIELN